MKKTSFALLMFVTFSFALNAKSLKINNLKYDNIEFITNFRCPVLNENKNCDVAIKVDCDMYAVNVIEDCYLCDDFLSATGYIYLFREIVEDCYRENNQ
jgi:hypothetical protein